MLGNDGQIFAPEFLQNCLSFRLHTAFNQLTCVTVEDNSKANANNLLQDLQMQDGKNKINNLFQKKYTRRRTTDFLQRLGDKVLPENHLQSNSGGIFTSVSYYWDISRMKINFETEDIYQLCLQPRWLKYGMHPKEIQGIPEGALSVAYSPNTAVAKHMLPLVISKKNNGKLKFEVIFYTELCTLYNLVILIQLSYLLNIFQCNVDFLF